MTASARIRAIAPGEDDGWAVYYRARKLREAGEDVTMLVIGDHDLPTPAPVVEAMVQSARGGNLGYAPVPGSPALRQAIAARIAARTGVATGAENVVVTPGGQAALFAAMMATLDPGDACIVIDPYYATYPLTVRGASGRMVLVPARAGRGFQPDPADLAAAAGRSGARAILINTPNNPTGAVYRRETLEAIAALCRARDIWLISDEVYEAQVHDGDHLSPRALPGMAERTLVIGSLSKSHAMTGWRIGWLAGPAAVVACVAALSIATTYGVPGFIQDAALFALERGAEDEAAIAARYRGRRDAALAALGNLPGLRVAPPEAGMYLMLDLRETGLSGEDFANRLLDEERIAVMPGESFGAAAAGHVRVALTAPEDRLAEAMRRLARLAAALAERRAAS